VSKVPVFPPQFVSSCWLCADRWRVGTYNSEVGVGLHAVAERPPTPPQQSWTNTAVCHGLYVSTRVALLLGVMWSSGYSSSLWSQLPSPSSSYQESSGNDPRTPGRSGQSTTYAYSINSYLKSGTTSYSGFSSETYMESWQIITSFLFIFSNRMVNDSSNVELIRWSDAGDSFFGAHHLPLNRLSTIPITVRAYFHWHMQQSTK
jgi:hypothetical protein